MAWQKNKSIIYWTNDNWAHWCYPKTLGHKELTFELLNHYLSFEMNLKSWRYFKFEANFLRDCFSTMGIIYTILWMLMAWCFSTRPSGATVLTNTYRQVSNIRRTLVGSKIVDHSGVVGALPVGTAPTTSSFLTWHLASLDWAKTTARRDEKQLSLEFGASYIRDLTVVFKLLDYWVVFSGRWIKCLSSHQNKTK